MTHKFLNYISRLKILRFRYKLLLLIALVVADGLITEFLINYKISTEANPFLHKILETGNLIPVKVAGAILCALILAHISKSQPKLAAITVWCFIAFYAVVVYWNIGGLLLSVIL